MRLAVALALLLGTGCSVDVAQYTRTRIVLLRGLELGTVPVPLEGGITMFCTRHRAFGSDQTWLECPELEPLRP